MYDVAVIGNDISSQVAALAASCFGFKVVLIKDGWEPMNFPGQYPPFSLDPFPLTGFNPGQTMEKLTAFLGLEAKDISGAPAAHKPILQVIFPDKRLDLVTDGGYLEEELARAFPRLAGKGEIFHRVTLKANSLVDDIIELFFSHLGNPEKTFSPRGADLFTRRRWIGPSFDLWRLALAEPMVPHLVSSLGLMTSYLHISNFRQTAAAYALALPWRIAPPGFANRGSVYSWLEEMNRSRSQIMDMASVMRLKIREDIKIDVHQDGATQVLKSRHLILSSNWEKIELLIGRDWQGTLTGPARRMEPVFFPLSLHLRIPDRIIPERMAPCLVYNQRVGGKTRESNNNFLLDGTFLNYRHPVGAGPGHLGITVFSGMPPWRMTSKELMEASTLALNGIDPLLPFLKDKVDRDDILRSLDHSRKMQEQVNHIYVMRGQRLNNLKLLPPATGYGNVFIAGGMLGAGFGFEGELLAGLGAASQLTRKE